jgi:hypothetical protein
MWVGYRGACVCVMGEYPSRPPDGSYTLKAYGKDGSESEAVVTPPFHFPEPVPAITYPTAGSVVHETAPLFQWQEYKGFTCEGPAPVPPASQWVDVSTPDEATWLWTQYVPVNATSVPYSGPPLEAGHDYTVHLWEDGPCVHLAPTPGVRYGGQYREVVRRDSTFLIYSPNPVIQSMYVDRGPVRDWNGALTYFEEVGVSVTDLDGIGDIASVAVTDSRGNEHPAELRSQSGPNTADFWWPAWGQEGPPISGTYTVTVTDWEGNSDLASGVTSAVLSPEDLPLMLTPDPGWPVIDETPVFTWSAPGSAGCFCMGLREVGGGPWNVWNPPGPVASPLAYGGPELAGGHSYEWFLNYHTPDGQQSDPRVSCTLRPTATGRFVVYSPVPVINQASVCRAECLCPWGYDAYHESVRVSVTDCAGWQDVSVLTETPDGLFLPREGACDASTNDGPFVLNQATGHDAPAAPQGGSYTITATGSTGSATLTSGYVSPIPPMHEITYPTDGAVIPETETVPIFSWAGAPGAEFFCVCVQDRDANDAVLWVRRFIPGDVTSIVYNDDGSATVPELTPGVSYMVHVRAHYPDEAPSDGVSADTFTATSVRFWLYGPEPPVIEKLQVCRGRDTSPEGQVSYHQWLRIYVSDADGRGDIASVALTDSASQEHTARKACEWDPFTAAYCWESYGEDSPSPAGTYTVTAKDRGGNSDSLSAQVSDIPEVTPVLLVPPANYSVAPIPLAFSWSGPGDVCYCLGVRGTDGECAIWCGGREVSGSTGTADYEGPDLVPGGLYEWFVYPVIADLPQSDPRAKSWLEPIATGRFWVEPEFIGFLEPINNDGSSIFKLKSTVPVRFRLLDVDGSYKTDAVATLSLAKVENDIVGTYQEAVSTNAPDSGNAFRYVGDHYQFNLGTKNLSTGTWRLQVTVDGVVAKEVLISLK